MIGAVVATVAGIVAGAVLGGVVRGVVEVVVVVALVEPDCPFELDPSAAVVRTESVGEPPTNGTARQPSVTRAARQNEGTRAELRPLAQSQIATGRANTQTRPCTSAGWERKFAQPWCDLSLTGAAIAIPIKLEAVPGLPG